MRAIPLLRSIFRALKSSNQKGWLTDISFFVGLAPTAPPHWADRRSGSSTYSIGTGAGSSSAPKRVLVGQAGIRLSTCPNMLYSPPPRWLQLLVSLGPPYLRCSNKSPLPFRIAEVSARARTLHLYSINGSTASIAQQHGR